MTHEERRAAILDAALRLFAERGFRGTTTRALAEAVGVTEPVLYEHFRSKRDLYFAIAEAKSKEGMETAKALLMPFALAKDDRALFTRLGEFLLERHAANPEYLRLQLFVALEDPDIATQFHRNECSAREGLASYIRQRIEDGAFRPVDPAMAARGFLGMILQQGLLRVLYGDEIVRKDPKRVVGEMVGIFLNGITKDGK